MASLIEFVDVDYVLGLKEEKGLLTETNPNGVRGMVILEEFLKAIKHEGVVKCTLDNGDIEFRVELYDKDLNKKIVDRFGIEGYDESWDGIIFWEDNA